MPEFVDNANVDDMRRTLIGRRISAIDVEDKSIWLDNGDQLILDDAAEWSSWYEVAIAPHLDFADNIITDVIEHELPVEPSSTENSEDDENETSDVAERFTLTILSRDKALVSVDAEGDPDSGWYVNSFAMRVLGQDEATPAPIENNDNQVMDTAWPEREPAMSGDAWQAWHAAAWEHTHRNITAAGNKLGHYPERINAISESDRRGQRRRDWDAHWREQMRQGWCHLDGLNVSEYRTPDGTGTPARHGVLIIQRRGETPRLYDLDHPNPDETARREAAIRGLNRNPEQWAATWITPDNDGHGEREGHREPTIAVSILDADDEGRRIDHVRIMAATSGAVRISATGAQDLTPIAWSMDVPDDMRVTLDTAQANQTALEHGLATVAAPEQELERE